MKESLYPIKLSSLIFFILRILITVPLSEIKVHETSKNQRSSRGGSPEKWVGVLGGTFRVWNSKSAHLLGLRKTSRPTKFCFLEVKNRRTISQMNASLILGCEITIWIDLFAPFRVNYNISRLAPLPTSQGSPPPGQIFTSFWSYIHIPS